MSSIRLAILVGLPLAIHGLAPVHAAAPIKQTCSTNPLANGTYFYYAPPTTGGNQQCLDVYLPATAVGQTVLFMHGGGGVGGDKAGDTSYCLALANLGYHVVSANYTLAVGGNNPVAGFPQAVKDAKAAVAWIRTDPHGLELPTCLIAVGNSAGGTLAALLATTDNDGIQQLEPAANTTYGNTEDFHVDGLVTFAGTMDFVAAGCTGYQILDASGNRIPCQGGISCGTDPDWASYTGYCCHDGCNRVPCNSGGLAWCSGYVGTTAAEVFLGVAWPASPTICPPADPHGTATWTGDAFIDASPVHWADSNDPPYFGFSAQLDPLAPGIQTGMLVDALGMGLADHAFKTYEQGCGHGTESLFEPSVSCDGAGACAAWEPLGACLSGCNSSAGRSAYQTHLAITGLGSCP